jgi:DNA-directed RNA polymerase specialized sigma24 family protein
MRHHGSVLRRQAARHAPTAHDAEDAMQDACVQFLRCYDGPPGVDALRWMQLTTKRCAWATARDRVRRQCVTLAVTDAPDEGEAVALDDMTTPARILELRDEHLARLTALSGLKPDERSALFFIAAGYSYREVAAMQGWTYTKVNRCLAEGRVVLRSFESKED